MFGYIPPSWGHGVQTSIVLKARTVDHDVIASIQDALAIHVNILEYFTTSLSGLLRHQVMLCTLKNPQILSMSLKARLNGPKMLSDVPRYVLVL